MKGNVDEVLALGTLAAATLISADFDEVVEEKMLVSSIVSTYSLRELTAASGAGPIVVGVAHSDYTDAEIEAWLETTDSWDQGDLVQGKEVRNRLIRRIGIFGSSGVLNDGKPIKTRLNWLLRTGQTLSVWGYNRGASALATTDPQIVLEGHVNLWGKS